MGRKTSPSAPAAAVTVRRKRKGSSFPPPAACKRPTLEMSGWASLPTDLARLVASRVLAEDVVDYIAFRAVCSGWRACTFNPRSANLSLRKPCLRPRGWVALCDGDAAAPDETCEITFFHTRTARRLRVRLPEFRRHMVIGFTDGLVILLHTRTTAVRVLHPFTRDAADLAPLAPAFHKAVKARSCMLTMSAFVCEPSRATSSSHIAVLAHFPRSGVALCSMPGVPGWAAIHHGLELNNILPFQGRVYATVYESSSSKRIIRVFPPDKTFMAFAPVCRQSSREFLVESGGRMLLVDKHTTRAERHAESWRNYAHKIFEVDLRHRKLIPLRSLGDEALFLNEDRCLSVSAKDLPSISGDSIYFSMIFRPAVLYSLAAGVSEELAASRQIHDDKERTRPSVRPFTIADHLLTYCHHDKWARGLMLHEYHRIPESFEELHKKIKAQYSRLRIPRT